MDQARAAPSVLRGESRKRDVAKNLETPQIAGLLVQTYGYGLCDAFWAIYEGGGDGPTYRDVDRAVESIDPDWRTTQAAHWKAVADLDVSTPRP